MNVGDAACPNRSRTRLREACRLHFLNAFLRGNRDNEPRKGDATITQALSLMNDAFVVNTRVNSTAANSTLVNALKLPNDQAVTMLYQEHPVAQSDQQRNWQLRAANLQGAGNATGSNARGAQPDVEPL